MVRDNVFRRARVPECRARFTGSPEFSPHVRALLYAVGTSEFFVAREAVLEGGRVVFGFFPVSWIFF